MRKRFKVAISILAMVVGIFLSALPAEASFWIKGTGFHYSPDYGSLKDGLDKTAPHYETPKRLKAGTGTAFSAGWDFSQNWGIRLDAFSFTGTADYRHLRLPDTFLFKTSTSPVLLSVVYRIPTERKLRPYLGAGIGSFPSKLTIHANIPERDYEDKDSVTGFQVLAGAELELKGGLFFSGEFRYLSAKAEYPGYRCIESCSTDWSGILASIGVGYRFGL